MERLISVRALIKLLTTTQAPLKKTIVLSDEVRKKKIEFISNPAILFLCLPDFGTNY
jgi:hypothetical protein